MNKAILILLALASLAHADYHYAGHEGTNEYPYTSWETATDSIQLAVDAAEGGDTIFVGSGDYHQQVRLRADSLALIGMGMDSTRIWWDVFRQEIILIDSMALISDIFIEHTANFGNAVDGGWYGQKCLVDRCHFEGGGIMLSHGGGEISNCIFNGLQSSVHTWIATSYLKVVNCIIITTDNSSIFSDSDTNIIINNIIYSDREDAISLHLGQVFDYIANNLIIVKAPWAAIYIGPQNTELSFVNNTIDTVAHWQFHTYYGLHIFRDNIPVRVSNNTISGATRGGISLYSVNKILYASYNNFWNNGQDFYVWESSSQVDTSYGVFHENPMYVSDSDYHLQAYSPLIDAGDPDILDVDFSRSDIGCYGGPGGESYFYEDLAPAIPDSLSAQIDFENSLIYLNWRYNTEADFDHYYIYRDTVSNFEPSIFNLIAEPETSHYIDTDWPDGYNYYYKIAAIDNQDNLSAYSEELPVIITSVWGQPGVEIPLMTSIIGNYPNPFNSATTIVYRVANIGPMPAKINIAIYDITGRKIRTLLNERKNIGEYQTFWDGRDDKGNECSSGVYFVRISQWDEPRLSSKRKLLLIR